MKKLVMTILSLSLLTGTVLMHSNRSLGGQEEEMRGVWISTIYCIDYPSVKSNAEKQKQEFIVKLEETKKMGLNTVAVQVRPKADAFYESDINPWSEILTGVQGKNPGFDPMTFMIEETHKRGMEFHAWLNPYRITTKGTDLNVLVENHPARVHPEWVLSYNDALYYNPGVPEVKQHIADTVKEIVERYDVDAIQFDDYFYPSNYPLNPGETRDGAQANQRRQHINDMIEKVSQTIQNTKPSVKFGVSPSGIWKNSTSDPSGSDTKGYEGYYSVYADVRTWIANEWVDYIVPQIYWETGNKLADYETLVKWWSKEVQGTNVKLYIGQATYKDTVAQQIVQQLNINKKYNINGSFFFSLRDLQNNRQGSKTALINYYNGEKETKPEMSPPSIILPLPPTMIPPTPILPTIPEDTSSSGQVPIVIEEKVYEDACVTTSPVLVNGKKVAFQSYNINDYNYFKLRDVAMALTGSEKQFDTVWNEEDKAIHLALKTPYTQTGGELVKGNGKNKKALQSLTKLYLNGNEMNMVAYNIDGNNYFRLRDLGALVNFGVTWDNLEKQVGIDTSLTYQD